MNIGTHQYPQPQPLLFHLPDSAGRAQAVPKPRGQGAEVSGDEGIALRAFHLPACRAQ